MQNFFFLLFVKCELEKQKREENNLLFDVFGVI